MSDFLKAKIKNRVYRWFREEVDAVKASISSIDLLKVEAQSLRAETGALHAETAALHAETAALHAETAALHAETATLRAEAATLRAEIAQLENTMPILRNEIGVLRFQIEPLQSKLYQNWLASSQSYGRLLSVPGKDDDLAPLHKGYKVFTNSHSWIDFDQLTNSESPDKVVYKKTIDFAGEFANEQHRALSVAPGGRMGLDYLIDIGIDGFLLTADALKIYEMAYFSDGNILELGTHKGLSTTIIAGALEDSNHGLLETIDIDVDTNEMARNNVSTRPGSQRVTFTVKNATDRLDELVADGRKFGFIFVDHWHGYDATFEVAIRAIDLLVPGGFILFHDFVNSGNFDREHVYGVFPAIIDAILPDDRFRFYGNSGCCALFRVES